MQGVQTMTSSRAVVATIALLFCYVLAGAGYILSATLCVEHLGFLGAIAAFIPPAMVLALPVAAFREGWSGMTQILAAIIACILVGVLIFGLVSDS